MNPEKSPACQKILRKFCFGTQEKTDLTKINPAFLTSMKISLKKTNSKSFDNFLNDIYIPSLSETQKQICEEELTEKHICESMISFDNNKLPGNDGLTKESY